MRTLDYIVLVAAGIFAIKYVLPLFGQAVAYDTEAQDENEQAILRKLLADLNKNTYGKPAQAQIEAAKKRSRAMAISNQMDTRDIMNDVRMMQAAHSQDKMLGLQTPKTNPYSRDLDAFSRRKKMDLLY